MSDDTPPKHEFTLKDTLEYLKDSGADYMRAKAELASIEAKEAAEESAKRAAIGAKLAFAGLFSYILLLVTLIGACTNLLEGKMMVIGEQHIGTWPIVTFGFFLIHLLCVFIFLDKLKTASKKVLFEHTVAELEKDKKWLEQIKANNEN
ncbi:phage holin family protein [Rubritalea tangerina]|uniref:Phage holin family protein n=1 Tax=Rubritalea tangerina TaxID=430798 RepID=A0ABW4ZFB6_9BACT